MPVKNLFKRSRHIFLYAGAMGVLLLVLKWLQWKYLITDNAIDLYVGLVALFFTFLGVWVANQLTKPKITVKTIVVEKEIYIPKPGDTAVNEAELKKLNLTTREYEVLGLLTKGQSNAEIAEKLFLSLSTVKTHASNLFVKMDVKNRTQAIEKANRLKLT